MKKPLCAYSLFFLLVYDPNLIVQMFFRRQKSLGPKIRYFFAFKIKIIILLCKKACPY